MNPFATQTIREIDVAALERSMADGRAHVLDVREEWEFRRSHVPGVLNVPLGQLPRRLSELPTDRPILVICEHGERSLVAAQFLANRGFPAAASVHGGTSAWIASRRPVERS